jgi:hypothetical protein
MQVCDKVPLLTPKPGRLQLRVRLIELMDAFSIARCAMLANVRNVGSLHLACQPCCSC